MADWITKSTPIDPRKVTHICMNFEKPTETPAFLKAVMLLVFPVGLELGTGGEGRRGTGPCFQKKSKIKNNQMVRETI